MKFIFRTYQKLALWLLFIPCLTLTAQTTSIPIDNQELIDQMYADATGPDGIVRCATTPMDMMYRSKNYEQDKNLFENYMKNEVQALSGVQKKMATVYEIPVIFHIIHNGEAIGDGDNLPLELIQAQLEQLNNDFRKIAGTTGDGGGVDTEIQFSFALLDEDGNLLPETGVNRIDRRTIPGLGNPPFTEITYDNVIKPNTQFDPNQYLNIWVGALRFSRGGRLLGFAQFPEAPGLPGIGTGNGAANTDGVVVISSSVGGSTLPNPSPITTAFDEGRTLTHEIGHWLGLRHTGGDGDCTVDDFCSDTPLANMNQFVCDPNPDSCPEPGNDPVENYMNFTPDDCMERYTSCQRNRMRIVLGETGNGSPRREILLSSEVDIITQGFEMVAFTPENDICIPNDLTIDFRVEIADNFNEGINMSVGNLPTGLSASFSQNPITSSGLYTVTISGTSNIPPTQFTMDIIGNASTSSFTNTTSVILQVNDIITNQPSLVFPANNTRDQSRALNFNWGALSDALFYEIQIATDANFSSVVQSQSNIIGTAYNSTVLAASTNFFWRVRGGNDCGSEGPWSSTFSFTTEAPTSETGTCLTPIMIECGMSLVGNLIDGENNIESYGRGNNGLTGVEQIYAIQVSEPSMVEFSLTNQTADGNLIIFSDCIDTAALSTGLFLSGTRDETAFSTLDSDNIYYIAVEADDDTILEGEYTLTVRCTPLCSSPSGLVETFENGEPADWQFSVSGTGDSGQRRWRFDRSIFGVGIDNAGSGSWASFDDFALGDNFRNNVATAISPVVDLSGHENIRLFFDYGFDETVLVRGDQTRLSITDGVQTYYWRGDANVWTTTLTPWLDDDDNQILITSDAIFNQLIPEGLDESNLSVTIVYDDGGGTRSGWGFGFDNFSLCGDPVNPPGDTDPIVEFVTPTEQEELVEGDDLPVVVTVTDDGSIANVELFLNDILVRRENFAPYEWAAPGQPDDILRNVIAGVYTLRVVATDNEGNTGEAEITLIVEPNTTVVEGNFDFGNNSSPLEDGFTRVTPRTTTGAFRWTNSNGLLARNRTGSGAVSDLNRDFIFARAARTFEVDVPNGNYQVTVTFGDLRFAHDNQQVSAENGQVVIENVDTGAGQFESRSFSVAVSDGALSLEFSDQGGSNPDWTVTSVSYTGGASLSRVATEIEDIKTPSLDNMIVGPNPVNDVLFINRVPKGEYTIFVYGLQGAEVMRQKTGIQNGQYELRMSSLESGLYIVRISNEASTVFRKILVNK